LYFSYIDEGIARRADQAVTAMHLIGLKNFQVLLIGPPEPAWHGVFGKHIDPWSYSAGLWTRSAPMGGRGCSARLACRV
jgi:hypothetical protein